MYRTKNPWFLLRRIVLGWKVLLGNKIVGSFEEETSPAEQNSYSYAETKKTEQNDIDDLILDPIPEHSSLKCAFEKHTHSVINFIRKCII